MRTELLQLLNDVAADGGGAISAATVRERLSLSPQSTSNLLARTVRDGLLDKVSSGTYALRPLGMLGTRAASEDVALAVAAKFADEPHRIVYRSALDYHGLLVHPARTVQLVLPRRVKVQQLSGRRLETFIESRNTLEVGGEPAGRGAFVSGVERALLESAARPRAVGGWIVVAEAVRRGDWNPDRLQALAETLRMGAALRRIGSMAEQIGPEDAAAALTAPTASIRTVTLDPHSEPEDQWLDRRWRVRWPTAPKRARELIEA